MLPSRLIAIGAKEPDRADARLTRRGTAHRREDPQTDTKQSSSGWPDRLRPWGVAAPVRRAGRGVATTASVNHAISRSSSLALPLRTPRERGFQRPMHAGGAAVTYRLPITRATASTP